MFIIRILPETTSQKILTPSSQQNGMKAGHHKVFLTDRLTHSRTAALIQHCVSTELDSDFQ